VSLLDIEDLTVRYGDGASTRSVLDAVSFSLDAGDVVGLSGPSGSGKTTIALALLGLLPGEAMVSGSIRFGGRELRALSERELNSIRGAAIGIVFQESALALHPTLTAGAQIADIARTHLRCDRRTARDRAMAALNDAGLDEGIDRIYDAYPHELSGGQRQRVLIAQAIVCQPSLVIADEPTASLDAAVRDEILRLIRRLNERHGTAFLIVSHSADVLAATKARVIAIDRGRLVRSTWMQDVEPPAGRVVRSLSRSVTASRFAPVAAVTGATKSFRQQRLLSSSRHEVQALDGIDLQVERGLTLGLTGPSACGKSTLARCLAGLESLDTGRVLIDGHDITSLRGRSLLPYRNQVQLIFQDSAAALNPRFTALEIVTEPMVIQQVSTDAGRRERAAELLSQVGLSSDRLTARAGEFSGGERQRLAIARALAVRPKLLILDEAFSGLDVDTRCHVAGLLNALQREHGLALLCISHDFEFLAGFAPEIAVMRRGRIVEQGATVRRFIAGAVA
jgi:ABC-type glutathione transport system ATPase component